MRDSAVDRLLILLGGSWYLLHGFADCTFDR